jgi:hypothetical protein
MQLDLAVSGQKKEGKKECGHVEVGINTARALVLPPVPGF